MKKHKLTVTVLATVVAGILASTSAVAAQKNTRGMGEAPKVNASGVGESEQFTRFIVRYHDGASSRNNTAAVVKNATTALSRAGLSKARTATGATSTVGVTYMRKLATGADLIRLSSKLDRVSAEAFARQLAADPNVAKVTLDRMRHATAQPAYVPNDPYFSEDHWHFMAPNGTPTFNGVANYGGSNVSAAWDMADGTGIVIAVLDTGITAHPDVDTSLGDAGYDFITDSYVSGRATDGRAAGGWDLGSWTNTAPWNTDPQCVSASRPPANSSWHGTHVSSTAGAELTDNGVGESGIAHGAKVLPVRVLGHCGGYDSDINDAIVWAAGGHVDGVPDNQNPAQVINLSLGGTGACAADDDAALAVAQAKALGAVVVVSAGNSNADASGYSPASCPGVITVASNGVTSKRAYYSNYGSTVEIAAPGGGVYANDGSSGSQAYDGFVWQALNPGTTTPVPVGQINANTAYGGMAGTSQAAPHVSGIVALMQGARLDADLPLLTPDEVLSILQSTAKAPHVTSDRPIGAGIVDAAAAVTAAVNVEEPCDPQTEECEPPGPTATPLTNKVPVAGLTGAAGSEALYSFEAQAGAVLSIMTYGGSGNVSVYVGLGEEPTTESYDSKSARAGNSETVRFTAPTAGTYYIKLTGAYSGLTLVARQ
jgi:serine protease